MHHRCLRIIIATLLLASLAAVASAQPAPTARPGQRGAESVKVGQLRRSSQPNGPAYILLDGIGGTRYFVEATPQVDLERYVDRDIIVHGHFTSDGRRQVLRARRVVSMQPLPDEPASDVQLASAEEIADDYEHSDGTGDASDQADVEFADAELDESTTGDAERVASATAVIDDLEVVQAQYEEEDPFNNPFADERLASRQLEPEPIDPLPADSGVGPLTDLEAQYYNRPYEPFSGNAPGYGPYTPPPYSEVLWIRGEYLLWSPQGMRLPPLVTTSATGTARSVAGVLGENSTGILLGNSEIHDDTRSGFRVRGGLWTNPAHEWGIEGEYFQLDDEEFSFSRSSTGNPILARPFFDALNGQETAELVAFPNVIRGTVSVDSTTEFSGAGGRLRYKVCCGSYGDCCGDPTCGNRCGMYGTQYRVDWIAGYRFLQLKDYIAINENLVSLQTANPGSFVLTDQFSTENEFHGGEIGMLYERSNGRWSLEMLTKVAIGNVHQVVQINGSTAITESSVTETFSGGLLTQRSNIGTYERDDFAVVPEIGVTLGYQLTDRWRAMVGYSLIYFSNVVRAGDQIDLDLNPNLLPPEVSPFEGPLRPAFAFDETDFWAHGLNLGIEFRH